MLHYAVFHMGLHSLSKYLFAGIQSEKRLTSSTLTIFYNHATGKAVVHELEFGDIDDMQI